MKLSRVNSESMNRKWKRMKIFLKLVNLGFLAKDDYRVIIRETRYAPCGMKNRFKGVIQ